MKPQEKGKNMETRKPQYNLSRDAYSLMSEEPFFARVFARLDKFASTGIPTAGVRYNPEKVRFEFIYNPRFMESLERLGRRDVCVHELYHIILDHCTSRSVSAELHRHWNIATDLAINSYLDNLPEGCCKPGVGRFAEYPPFKAADWYFNKLREEGEEGKEEDNDDEGGPGNPCDDGDPSDGDQEGDCDGEGPTGTTPGDPEGEGNDPTKGGTKGPGPVGDCQFDSHDGWCDEGSGDDDAREFAREKLRDMVREAIEQTDGEGGGGWGSVHSPMRDELRKTFKRNTINWRSVLRMFVQSSQPSKRRSSIRRLSRRYPWIHPGRRTDRVANIAVSIDQSGSVSSAELQEFYAELDGLSSLATFTVIPFDDQVFEEGIEEWKKGETKKWKRYTCGGTNFDAPTEYVNDNKQFDAHIIMTDMYAPKPKASRVPRMWVADQYNAKRPYFQPSAGKRILAITVDR